VVNDGAADSDRDSVSIAATAATVIVPDVLRLEQSLAEAAIVGAELVVGSVTTATSDTVPAGAVISQNPPGGTSALRGSAVDLVVTLCPPAGSDTLRPEVTFEVSPPSAPVGTSMLLRGIAVRADRTAGVRLQAERSLE